MPMPPEPQLRISNKAAKHPESFCFINSVWPNDSRRWDHVNVPI